MVFQKLTPTRRLKLDKHSCEWNALATHLNGIRRGGEIKSLMEENKAEEIPTTLAEIRKVYVEFIKELYEDGNTIILPIFTREIVEIEKQGTVREEDDEDQALINSEEEEEEEEDDDDAPLGKRKLFELLESFNANMMENVENIIKKQKRDEPVVTIDDEIKIINDKKMLEMRKDHTINKVLKNGVNYTNFGKITWTKTRLMYEGEILTQIGRLLELEILSKNEETKKKAKDLALKLIDRRLNALVMSEEGETWEAIEQLQPSIFSNRKNLYKEERSNMLQNKLMNSLLKSQVKQIQPSKSNEYPNKSKFNDNWNKFDTSKFQKSRNDFDKNSSRSGYNKNNSGYYKGQASNSTQNKQY
jgi:hypothetical protein